MRAKVRRRRVPLHVSKRYGETLIAYVLLIIIGGIGIIIPGLSHVCIACGSLLDTVLEVAAILVGIIGIATRGQAVAA